MFFHNTPITPKKLGPLQVLTLGRVSTTKQDIRMLEVQREEVHRFITSMYDGPLELHSFGEQISGDVALRESYEDACDLIEEGVVDIAILFDLSKAGRLPRLMHNFIDVCVDNETRFISIGDNIDTADPNWEIPANAASFRHATDNPHTRHRIKAQGDTFFLRGGHVTRVIFGYKKLTQEETDSSEFGTKGLRLAKLPESTPAVLQMKDMTMNGSSYEAVATRLNDESVPTGPYAKGEHWTGKMVIAYLRHPLLHGERQRSRYRSMKMRTKKRTKRWMDPNPLVKVYPELAHLTPEEHAELIVEMDRRVTEHPRKRRAKIGPKGRARSRSYFPGQAMICGVCGSVYYWHGNGCLKCSNRGNPAKGQCSNHVQVKPEMVRRKVAEVLLRCVEDNPRAKTALVQAALAECERLRERGSREQARLENQIKQLGRERRALVAAIRKGGELDVLVNELKDAEASLTRRSHELERMLGRAESEPIPADPETIREQLPDIVGYLMADSYEFADLLRRVIPVFRIEPLQAVDTGKPVPRAHVTFSFAALLERRPSPEYTPQPGDLSAALDLFEPPAHIQCLHDAVRIHQEHPAWSAEKIAAAISPEVKRWSVRSALKLHEQMKELGVTEPYVPVTDPAMPRKGPRM